jgi:hypothetical protein
MLLGLGFINWVIVPMKLQEPFEGLTNILQVVLSTIMVLSWLYLWRWIATKMFWRALSEITEK